MTTTLSRRGLLGPGAAALALAPTFVRAATGGNLEPQPAPPRVENIQNVANAQGRLTVETYLNDRGPYQFIVDTGAERSVIAEDIAQTLGLRVSEDVIVQGIARSLPAKAVQLDTLRMGRVRVNNMPMPLLPRTWLGADGYLGLDAINHQSVTFDFQNRSLIVQPSVGDGKILFVEDEAQIRVNGAGGKLTAVNASVDGARAYAFIDSGAEITIGNSNLFAAMQRNGSTYVNDEIIQLLGVTGGAAVGRVARIERVKVGSISFEHSALVISDLPVFDVWGLADKPALLIGMNFLRQVSSVTIDYGRKEIFFKLASALRIASNRA